MTSLAGTTPDPTGETLPTFFGSSVAPIFILGTSVFAIFWGVVNALLVSTLLFIFCNHST